MSVNVTSEGLGGKSPVQEPPKPQDGARILQWAARFWEWSRRARAVAGDGLIGRQTPGGYLLSVVSSSIEEPFTPSTVDAAAREITVTAGNCYVYGVAFAVAETDLTLDTDTTRVWVQFPITPGSGDSATVEFGTTAELNAVDRNTHGFRVLAHITIGGSNEIETLNRRWFAGDVYFDD